LPAALAAGNAPFAEVLTVISNDVIHVFAKSRARSRYDFCIGKRPRGMRKCKNALPVGELFQRDFLNGAALQAVAKTRVMHDSSVPNVNAVMRVESPVSDYMGPGHK
jgi:hypothetical protein